MTANLIVEYRHSKVNIKKIEERIKELWKEQGNRVKDIASLHIYYKSEEGMCYYVLNDSVEGCFSLESLDI